MSERRASDSPGLAAALDVETVLGILREALERAGEPLRLLGGSVVDVRYRPGQPCWILYRLKVRDADGRSRHEWISGQLLGPGQSPLEPPEELVARYRAENGRFPLPVVRVGEPRLTLFAYPLDGSLPGLFDAASPEEMRERFDRLWADRRVRVRDVRMRPLGYTPHARAAFAYEVLAESRRSGAPELRRLIGKMHAKKPAARLFADAWAVWRASKGHIGLAPPVGFFDSIGLTLQERVPGTRLGGLVERPGFTGRARRTARMLAKLHALEVPLSSRRKLAEELKGIRRWSGVLAGIKPELTERVGRLRADLLAEVEARFAPSGPIHADFHHTNVLVHENRITIIDLDEMAFGDPMVDVGRFLASLRVPARRAFGDLSALDEAGAAFLEGYLKLAGGDERRARLFESASLLIAAGSAFRIQRQGWEEEVSLLVEESERTLAAARAGVPVATGGVAPAPDARELSAEARLRWATDPMYMQAVLSPEVRAVYGAELERCRPSRRSRRGDRPRLRYDLEGVLDGQPWTQRVVGEFRERGGLSFFRRLQGLRRAMNGSPDGLLLPRPLEYVKRLRLLVWELPEGPPLTSLAGSDRLPEGAERLGRALAALHATAVQLDRTRTLERELTIVRGKLEGLMAERPELGQRAADLLVRAESRLLESPRWSGPSLRTLPPEHLLCLPDRLALDRIDDVAMAHPLIDVGDAAARLLLLGLRQGEVEPAAAAADRLKRAYGQAAAVDDSLVGPFEASALLRLSSGRRLREADGELSRELLAWAARRLDGGEGVSAGAANAKVGGEPQPSGLERRLHRAVGRRCRGRTLVIGAAGEGLRAELEGRDLEVRELEAAELTAGEPERFATVVVAEPVAARAATADALSEALHGAWERLEPGGRLLVVAPNRRPGDRKELAALLAPLGKPKPVTEQPYRWLLMEVRKRDGGRGRRDRSRQERYKITAKLCRGRVVELGSGEGQLARAIADRGHEVVGVELSRRRIATARELFPELQFIRGDIRDIDLPPRSFDTAVVAEVLEHVDDAVGTAILEKAWGLIREGGRLIVSVPNENCIPHPNHRRQFDAAGLTELLWAHGQAVPVDEQPFKWLLMYVDKG